MAKTIQEQLTNILLILSFAFGGTLGTLILSNQDNMQKDITAIKVSIGIDKNKIENIEKQNEKQENRLDKIQSISSIEKLFKHENIYTIKSK